MTNNPMERPLAEADPDIAQAIENEERRQHEGLELIASENFVSEAVLEAAGSVFTNKYAEGYPGKRYYGGCEFTDVVENLARDRAKQLFGAEHANVQPHSGSTANMAAYAAVIQARRHRPRPEPRARRPPHPRPSAELLRQDLQDRSLRRDQRNRDHRLRRAGADRRARAAEADHRRRQRLSAHHRLRAHAADRRQSRRHLSCRHGALRGTGCRRRASFAGAARADRHHHHAQDAARPARRNDPVAKPITPQQIDKVVFPGMQGGPLVHIMAAKAVCFREAMQPSFKDYARQIVANAKALAQTLNDEGFHIVSGGTDTHLMLINVFAKGMLGSGGRERAA